MLLVLYQLFNFLKWLWGFSTYDEALSFSGEAFSANGEAVIGAPDAAAVHFAVAAPPQKRAAWRRPVARNICISFPLRRHSQKKGLAEPE
jgi:hypothetical protein